MSGSTNAQQSSYQPAFQGHHTSTVRVVFYAGPGDPRAQDIERSGFSVIGRGGTAGQMSGTDERSDTPSVVYATTTNALGTAGGSWEVHLKPGRFRIEDLREVILEDDWCDIEFDRNGRRFHVMRGLVDSVHKSVRTLNGATDITYKVKGRSFGKIFESSQVYFDRFTDNDYIGFASARLWQRGYFQNFAVNDVLRAVMFGFLQEIQDRGRSVFQAIGVPNEPGATFASTSLFDDREFSGLPSRRAIIDPHFYTTGGNTILDHALQWADLSMCELIFDLAPAADSEVETDNGGGAEVGAALRNRFAGRTRYWKNLEACPIGDTRCRIFFRDRPFPTFYRGDTNAATVAAFNRDLNAPLVGSFAAPDAGPWFQKLTEFVVFREGISAVNVSRSGFERKNMFFANGPLVQEDQSQLRMLRPLVNKQSVRDHGVRPMDVTTRYGSVLAQGTILGMPEVYRHIIRDFHALNHLFFAGSMSLAPGRPDIRVGHKLVVPAEGGLEREEYYVEGVTHEWSRPSGVRSEIVVTRGYVGDADGLLTRLTDEVADYAVLPFRPANATETAPRAVPTAQAPDGPVPEVTPDGVGARYAPRSTTFVQLMADAAARWGVPDWSEDDLAIELLSYIVETESGGWVGRPNCVGYPRRCQPGRWADWQQIHRELQTGDRGVYSGERDARGIRFTANGLGQLTFDNVLLHYPEGRNSYGSATGEMAGMIRYIIARYQPPGTIDPLDALTAAYDFKQQNGTY